MKSIKIKSIVSAFVFILFMLKGINATSATADTLRIKTSAVCGECKEIIEQYLSFEKGVTSSNLDVESKIVTVVFNPDKTTPDKIRIAVTKSGYDADSLKADPKAFRKLPQCCKNPHNE